MRYDGQDKVGDFIGCVDGFDNVGLSPLHYLDYG
jgi:hypothetical protein